MIEAIKEISILDVCKTVEYLLKDWCNKKIIDVGCGISINYDMDRGYIPVLTCIFSYFLISRKIVPSEKNLTLIGFDDSFLDKSEDYLKKFEKKFNFKPVGGDVSKIDSIIKGEFDIVMSSCFFGYPTEDQDLELIMESLYKITKKDGYHCHFKSRGESFDLSREKIEDLGFKVLEYFNDNTNLMILKKD